MLASEKMGALKENLFKLNARIDWSKLSSLFNNYTNEALFKNLGNSLLPVNNTTYTDARLPEHRNDNEGRFKALVVYFTSLPEFQLC